MATTPTLSALWTAAGMALAASAQQRGLHLEIDTIALGRGRQFAGGYTGYEPQRGQTGLLNEFVRRKINDVKDVSATAVSLSSMFEATPNDPTTMGSVFEVGFFATDGTLVAVWSDTTGAPILIRSHLNISVMTLIMTIDAMPRELVQFIVSPGPISVYLGSIFDGDNLLAFASLFARQAALQAQVSGSLLYANRIY